MSTRQRMGLVLGVLVVGAAVLNALQLWPSTVAADVAVALQLITATGAMVCGLVIARRVTGAARWWRLSYSAVMAVWVIGHLVDLADGDSSNTSTVSAIAYLCTTILALAAVALLLVCDQRARGAEGPVLQRPSAVSVLDTAVAALSFLILAVMSGVGVRGTWSGSTVDAIFAGLQLVLVTFVVCVAMLHNPARIYRVNLILLVLGIVAIAASDRLVTYLDLFGADGLILWGGLGFIVGPLLVAFAMLEPTPRSTTRVSSVDWVQLIMPFTGFLGIVALLAFHFFSGQKPPAFAVAAAGLTALLLTVRQVIAMRSMTLVTDRLYAVQRGLAHQVLHDPLTGLPNRILLTRRLNEVIGARDFVLIFVDLDDFKMVNDQYGHAAGDELLVAVGERLRRCVAAEDTLARVGGDEFAVLVADGCDDPGVVADRLRVALRDPFPVHGNSVRVRASMGLVRAGVDDAPQTSDDLLRKADTSMYASKRLGKDTTVVYQPRAGVHADFVAAMRAAPGRAPAGFRLVYQPVVALPAGNTVALEALARWTAPNGVEIAPETFVAAAEAAGLGAEFDALVLDLTCRQIASTTLALNIHVNVGAARLGNADFEDTIRHTLARHNIAPTRLVLEITETVPIVDLTAAAAQIRRLNELGLSVALDDFGAGYNSLTYLHTLPVQIVKLDRGLAEGTGHARDLALYRSMVAVCTNLGCAVVAEGIETPGQSQTVAAAGCQYAQGYLYGRPEPLSALS
ncbi:GGDEF-domain containing protein [Mycolicibacterium murale]|uniref:GGDEF-domain containing protein n=1 Tax=Mycolicibacterium murale TaxID=182220 RepID=A0A7I9WIY2_9MYCO|nr:bifunctional diguanylate cyclase/phosphodiesterase [Mycolicibacterium murale]GFG57549.1 GGDEF-domain containing protein [Mycolicibacterium murale]